jgi:Na+-translocating ferredoxin:NAD+ oxidoreductase RnfD subunit
MFGRALWLGDPLSIPLHQMQNGALLIFAFFMISDPKTTPDARIGRVIYAAFVASVAYFIQFVLYEPSAPVLALIVCAPVVPAIDALFRGQNYRWDQPKGLQKDLSKNMPKGVYQ